MAHAFRKACNAASVCSGASSGRKCRPGSALPVTFMAARACQVAMTSNIRAVFPPSAHSASTGQAILRARSAVSC